MTEPTPEPKNEQEANPIGEVYEQLTGPERLVAIGAVLVAVLSWLIGDVFFNDYDVKALAWLGAVAAAAAIISYFKGKKAPWHAMYPWAVAVIGVGVGLLGVEALLEDFRIDFVDGITWLFRVSFYVGAGLMGAGGIQLMRGGYR